MVKQNGAIEPAVAGFRIYEFSDRGLDTKESEVELGAVLPTERFTGETELPRYFIRQQASRVRQ